MRTRLVIAALAVPVALLSACGSDDGGATEPEASTSASDTPSESPSESATDTPTEAPTETPTETADPTADWPACDSVWADGARLPHGYKGCKKGDTAVKADSRGCSFGRPLVTYADRFYGVPSGIIHETMFSLKKDAGYRSALASCTA
jgi:hypothetical protein